MFTNAFIKSQFSTTDYAQRCTTHLVYANFCQQNFFLNSTVYAATVMTSATELRTSLERHNDAFESLLKLIPAKHYLPRDESLDVTGGSKYQKHTKVSKEVSKKAKRAKVSQFVATAISQVSSVPLTFSAFILVSWIRRTTRL